MTQRIDAIPGMPLQIGSTTAVRYVAGKRVGRWILSGMASDEVDDDCGNGDRDEP
jgi:hypothetical protein